MVVTERLNEGGAIMKISELPFVITQTEGITVNGTKPTFIRRDGRDVIYVSGKAMVVSPCPILGK